MNDRNKKIAIGAAILVLAVLVFFIFFRPQKITNYPSEGKDIIAFGDSLVEGVGSSAGGGFVPLLSKQLGVPIVNLGRSGDTTADGLARVSDIFAYDPKVVMVLLGGNDELQRIPRAKTFENLEKIVADIQSRGAVVLLLGVRGGLLTDSAASDYQALAKQYGTAYVSDVLSGIFAHPDLMSDGIHPNDKGYAIIAGRVAPVLRSLLK